MPHRFTISFYFTQSRDRMGTKKAKPLWTEIMELLGGEYAQAKERFYAEGYTEREEE